jgi:DNA gyrase subunit A
MTWQQPANCSSPRKQGTVKKTALNDFANVRKGGIIAIGIDPGDTLIDVKLTRGSTWKNEKIPATTSCSSPRTA